MNHKGIKGVCALLALMGVSLTAEAATKSVSLYMTEGDKTISIPLYDRTYTRTFWVEGFTDVAGRIPEVGGVRVWANEGDTINLTVYNNTPESHGFMISNGVLAATTIPAGTNKTFTFAAPPAGSYIYYDPTTDAQTKVANRAAGMYGGMVIYPAGQSPGGAGNVWTGGPAYKYDYIWLLSDFDKRVNAADKTNTAFTGGLYKATYGFINGDFGVHSLKNALTSPVVNVGDTLAIRIINGGMIAHPIHFHGYHGELVSINNVPQNRVVEKDVLDVPPMTTMDLVFHINQKGVYIIHDHTGMMVTQDGIYAEGMIAEFDVCKKEGGLIANDPYCPIPTIGVPGGGWR